jgi:tetratricopeptide (TPR) repeat protein
MVQPPPIFYTKQVKNWSCNLEKKIQVCHSAEMHKLWIMKAMPYKLFFVFSFCFFFAFGVLQAQLVTRYGLLVDMDFSPEGSQVSGIQEFSSILQENGFIKGNIRLLEGKQAGRDEVLFQLYEISKLAQPGDLVYFHLQAQAGQIPTVSPTEDDNLDEYFRGSTNQPSRMDSLEVNRFLVDNQLAKYINKIRDKLGFSGCLVVSLDIRNQPDFPFLKKSKPENWLDFLDVSPDDKRSRLVYLSSVNGKENEHIDRWLRGVLNGKDKFFTFEDLRNHLQTSERKGAFLISGSLDEPFFHQKPETRKWQEFKRKISGNHLNGKGKVYAMAVGASDYKGRFENLKYAPTDAFSFYQYLKRSIGPKFVDDTTFLLLNQRATSTRVFEALKTLNSRLNPEDALYFYFAGHGDVEGDLISRPGFLLLPDGPEKAYSAGGHIAISELKDFLANFLFKGCRVFMIVDACHSGRAEGNSGDIDDNFFRLPNIDKELVRFLACQPNERSFEGEVFGGGFGAFTYCLLRGMQGDADADKDKVTDVKELSVFLRSRVAELTNNRQNPLIEGPEAVAVAPVIQVASLQELKSLPRWITPLQSSEKMKSKDSLIVQAEKLFYKAIASKSIVIPEKNAALSHLRQLQNLCSPADFQARKWTSDFVQAAFEKSQAFINQYIAGNESVAKDTLFRLAARELDAGLTYLSPENPTYFPMVARSLFFKANSISPELYFQNDHLRSSLQPSLQQLRNALKIEPVSPHIENSMGRIFFATRQFDSAVVHYRRAISLAPKWKFPYNNLGGCFQAEARKAKNQALLDSSARYLGAATRLDAKYLIGTANLAETMLELGRKEEAKKLYQRCIFLKVKEPMAYHRLADIYRGDQIWDSAFAILEQGLALNPDEVDLLVMQGNCCFDYAENKSNQTRDSLLNQALQFYRAAEARSSIYLEPKVGLSNIFWSMGAYDSSAYYAGLAWELDTNDAECAHYQVDALFESGKLAAAERVLVKMDKRFPDDALRLLKWGLLWRKKNNPKIMLSFFSKAAKAGLKKGDFEAQLGWEKFSGEKWYADWLRIWK